MEFSIMKTEILESRAKFLTEECEEIEQQLRLNEDELNEIYKELDKRKENTYFEV